MFGQYQVTLADQCVDVCEMLRNLLLACHKSATGYILIFEDRGNHWWADVRQHSAHKLSWWTLHHGTGCNLELFGDYRCFSAQAMLDRLRICHPYFKKIIAVRQDVRIVEASRLKIVPSGQLVYDRDNHTSRGNCQRLASRQRDA